MKVQLATRLDSRLRQRLRIYAAVTGRTVEDVVTAALDGYYLCEAPDLDAAIALATRIPATRLGATIEIRSVVER